MLIAALPAKEDFIKTADPGAFYHLIDELETQLLEELKRALAGDEDDRETVKRAGEISKLAGEVVQSAERQAASENIDRGPYGKAPTA